MNHVNDLVAELSSHLSRQSDLYGHWPAVRAFLSVELAVDAPYVDQADAAQRLASSAVGAERVVWALVADYVAGRAALDA